MEGSSWLRDFRGLEGSQHHLEVCLGFYVILHVHSGPETIVLVALQYLAGCDLHLSYHDMPQKTWISGQAQICEGAKQVHSCSGMEVVKSEHLLNN